jgi:hypothetical protein
MVSLRDEMNKNYEHSSPRVATYLALLAVQIIAAIIFVWIELPAFRHVALSPGQQLPYVAYDDLPIVGTLLVMQTAYWYRFCRIPIPFRRSHVVLNHLFLFLGRLSFIFGGTLFSVVFFRHLPELDRSLDVLLLARRGVILACALFALFCVTLELERLGHALGNADRS